MRALDRIDGDLRCLASRVASLASALQSTDQGRSENPVVLDCPLSDLAVIPSVFSSTGADPLMTESF